MTSRHPRPLAAISLAAIALVALFVANARWGPRANVDGGHRRSGLEPHLSDPPSIQPSTRSDPWFVEDRLGRIVGDRAPGLMATALPAYAIVRSDEFSNTPGTITALLLTLAAVAVVV